MKNIDQKKKAVSKWFKTLQNEICSELEFIEEQKTNKITEFTKKIWLRNNCSYKSFCTRHGI